MKKSSSILILLGIFSVGWCFDFKGKWNEFVEDMKDFDDKVKDKWSDVVDDVNEFNKDAKEKWSELVGDVKEKFKEDPLMGNFTQMATHNGYPVTHYEIPTEDGYILTIFRIPGKKGEILDDVINTGRTPLLYIHGVVDSSDGVICNNPTSSPGYYFPENNLDMWYYNARGNTYSKKHTNLTVDDKNYWDFTFTDFAYYDIPAVVDHIIKETKMGKVHILGHSQGTMISWAMLTNYPERIKGKIGSISAWAPVARTDHSNSKLVEFLLKIPYLVKVLKTLNIRELLPKNFVGSRANKFICGVIPVLCKNILSIIADKSEDFNQTTVKYYLGHYPNGISLKNSLHLYYINQAKTFGFYPNDTENPEIVAFDFKKSLDIPVAMFAGSGDTVADPEDYFWLKEQLEEAGVLKLFKEYTFGHLAFLIPTDLDIGHLVDTLAFIRQYE